MIPPRRAMEAYVSVQRGFLDLDERYAALSAAGDPLDVDFR